MNQITHLLVDSDGVKRLRELYPRLTGVDQPAREIVYRSKQEILRQSMSSELTVLAAELHDLAKLDRASCDFTRPVLHRALREIIACFPVYRTYTRPQGWEVSAEDQGRIGWAVRWAKRRNPTMAWSALDYVASVLMMQFPPHLTEEARHAWRAFAVRFQQVTGPVTAKGYEDTTFYRYYPLASLNEVGGEVDANGLSIDEFHRLMTIRGRDWPLTLSATATHDTKRGEDVRARLHVLSEIPDEWGELVCSWNQQTSSLLQDVDDDPAPSDNVRYLLYQTLIGTWPLEELGHEQWDEYVNRIATYMQKALREAKLRSSWLNPSLPYEEATEAFLRRLLVDDRRGETVRSIDALSRRIAGAGFVNSLSQVVLKCMAPGVPDFYQGTDFWNFRLVDPDNRRPVDYEPLRKGLEHLKQQFAAGQESLAHSLAERWHEQLKLYITWRSLDVRKRLAAVFATGEYVPLSTEGVRADHLIAFQRGSGMQSVVVLVPRRVQHLPDNVERETGVAPPNHFTGNVWRDNYVMVPAHPGHWKNEFSGKALGCGPRGIDAAEILGELPVAILTPVGS